MRSKAGGGSLCETIPPPALRATSPEMGEERYSYSCVMMVSAPETLTPFSVSMFSVFTTPFSTNIE